MPDYCSNHSAHSLVKSVPTVLQCGSPSDCILSPNPPSLSSSLPTSSNGQPSNLSVFVTSICTAG